MHMTMQVSTELCVVVTSTKPVPFSAHVSRIYDATSLFKTLEHDHLPKTDVVTEWSSSRWDMVHMFRHIRWPFIRRTSCCIQDPRHNSSVQSQAANLQRRPCTLCGLATVQQITFWKYFTQEESAYLRLLLHFPASFTATAAAAVLHQRQCHTDRFLSKLVAMGIAHTYTSSYRFELYSQARCDVQHHTPAFNTDRARYATILGGCFKRTHAVLLCARQTLTACRHDLLLYYAALLLKIHAVYKAGSQTSALMMLEQDYANFRQVLLWTSQPSMRSSAAVHIYESVLWRGMPLFKERMPITLRLDFVKVRFELHALSFMK
jgi:hypothetical protein